MYCSHGFLLHLSENYRFLTRDVYVRQICLDECMRSTWMYFERIVKRARISQMQNERVTGADIKEFLMEFIHYEYNYVHQYADKLLRFIVDALKLAQQMAGFVNDAKRLEEFKFKLGMMNPYWYRDFSIPAANNHDGWDEQHVIRRIYVFTTDPSCGEYTVFRDEPDDATEMSEVIQSRLENWIDVLYRMRNVKSHGSLNAEQEMRPMTTVDAAIALATIQTYHVLHPNENPDITEKNVPDYNWYVKCE